MRLAILLLAISITEMIYAQDKFEIEKRVNIEQVPPSAVEGLAKVLGSEHKVKWYYQESLSEREYEAKFRFKSRNYSVEFYTTGVIYNVEIEVNLKKLKPKAIKDLKQKLKELFDDYKIRKIQIEYKGEEDKLFDLIAENKLDKDLHIQYEIEINAKSKKDRAIYELIFDDNIQLISKRKVKMKSTDILDY